MDYSIVAVPTIVGILSESLGSLNKHYSNRIPPSVITLAVECVKFGWSLLNGNYFKERDEVKQKKKAELLADEVKKFYLEVMKANQSAGTADEKETIQKLQEEHDLRLKELEVRLNVQRV